MIVGQANTLTFSLTAPSGVVYSSPVVTIESNPWATSSALTDNGDGTYSITITPSRETEQVIKLKVVQDGQTYYHALKASSVGPLSWLNPACNNQTGDGSTMFTGQLTTDGTTANSWNLRNTAILDTASLKLSSDVAGVGLSGVVSTSGVSTTASVAITQVYGTVDQYKLKIEVDAIHPISKRRRTMSHSVDMHRAITAAWVSSAALISGVESVLQFTLKFASGKPVTGVDISSVSITNGTYTPGIIVIDAAAGLYGIKVMPGTAASMQINVTVRVGNSSAWSSTGARTFTTKAGAFPTMSAMAGATRTIGIRLQDADGLVTDAQITAISAGAIMDAPTGGPWTPTANGVYFIPLPASQRGRPSNTNTTPITADTVNVTYTRAGKTVTVPCTINVVWLHAKVTGFTLTNNQLQFSGIVGGAATGWTFGQATFLDEIGTSLGTNGSNPVNNIATDGKVYWNLATKLTAQKYVSFSGTGSFSGSTFYYWSDPFEVTREAFLTMTPGEWNFSIAQSDAGKVVDLPDLVRTFKDDQGIPMTGLSLDTIPGVDGVSGFRWVFQPRLADGSDWSKVLVPVTDGSDGRYYVRLSATGKGYTNWWVNVFGSTFVFNTNEHGKMTFTFNSRIN